MLPFSNNLASLDLALIDEYQSPDVPFVPYLIWVMVRKEQETILRRIGINNRDIKKTIDLEQPKSKP